MDIGLEPKHKTAIGASIAVAVIALIAIVLYYLSKTAGSLGKGAASAAKGAGDLLDAAGQAATTIAVFSSSPQPRINAFQPDASEFKPNNLQLILMLNDTSGPSIRTDGIVFGTRHIKVVVMDNLGHYVSGATVGLIVPGSLDNALQYGGHGQTSAVSDFAGHAILDVAFDLGPPKVLLVARKNGYNPSDAFVVN